MNPLATAFEAATGQDEVEVIPTVAAPRTHHSREVYTGADLQMRSHRPGAYQAATLPSLFNGRQHTPGGRPSDVWTPPPSPAVLAVPVPRATAKRVAASTHRTPSGLAPIASPARVARSTYEPRPGSIPARLLAELPKRDGHMLYSEITSRYGLPLSSVTAVFKLALTKGALVRHVIDRRAALALPSFVPPPPSASKKMRELAEKLQAKRERIEALQCEAVAIEQLMRTIAPPMPARD
jgi:hypothetical protein